VKGDLQWFADQFIAFVEDNQYDDFSSTATEIQHSALTLVVQHWQGPHIKIAKK
jgi:hypothetical protein